MIQIPFPDEDDTPIHEAESVSLSPGQKATITLKPETSGNLHYIPVVALSKHDLSSYELEVDGNERYGPAPIPPTDPDDMEVTFIPSLQLDRKIKITIKDLRSSGSARNYNIQVIGWEA